MFPYRRILLKLSGETLCGSRSFGIDPVACQRISDTISRIRQAPIEVGVVIGGGNIFRGINLSGAHLSRTPADQMGMLATLFNGVALQNTLEGLGITARLMSALECPKIAESYDWRTARHALSQGEVVIFVGGTGNPYFTTDTAAALRATEMEAHVLIKATKVDGIYNKDPLKYSDAIKYNTISYSQVLADQLQVMDATAIALCRSHAVPIFVASMHCLMQEPITDLLLQRDKGTWVHPDVL